MHRALRNIEGLRRTGMATYELSVHGQTARILRRGPARAHCRWSVHAPGTSTIASFRTLSDAAIAAALALRVLTDPVLT